MGRVRMAMEVKVEACKVRVGIYDGGRSPKAQI